MIGAILLVIGDAGLAHWRGPTREIQPTPTIHVLVLAAMDVRRQKQVVVIHRSPRNVRPMATSPLQGLASQWFVETLHIWLKAKHLFQERFTLDKH
jgi:hypothetical protein